MFLDSMMSIVLIVLRLIAAGSIFKLIKDVMDMTYFNSVGSILKTTSNVFLVIMFAVQPDDRKSESTKGTGLKFSKFRKIFVQSSVYHSQVDTFNIFIPKTQYILKEEIKDVNKLNPYSQNSKSSTSHNVVNKKE